jgi:hypothetical protein
MTDVQKRLAASDTRGRIISIFLGAVLLPSVALSVLSFNAVPKHAENMRMSLLRQADQLLAYAEQDLEKSARRKALEAARAVGPERLLEGRPSEVRKALRAAGPPSRGPARRSTAAGRPAGAGSSPGSRRAWGRR